MSSTAADVALSSASSSAASSRMSRAPPSRHILSLSSGGMEFSSPPSCRPRRGPSGRTLPLPCGSSPPSRPRWPAAGCRRPRPNGSRPPRPLRNSARASLPFPHTRGTVRPETALCPRRDRSRSCPAEGGLKEAGKPRPPLWRNRYRNRRHPAGPLPVQSHSPVDDHGQACRPRFLRTLPRLLSVQSLENASLH